MKTSPMVLGPNHMKNLSEYAKTAEAAQILGVAQNTLRKWAEQGDIPVHRNPANGYRLFKREDLMRFLKKIDQSSKSGS
jgi:excisionase family DNA binding protein